jgi:uncharacterized protein (TIGR02118 family)
MDKMVKVIVLLKKRSDVSYEKFRDHYENIHAPLVTKLLPHFTEYKRNYIVHGDPGHRDAKDLFPFDVVTELRFASLADHDQFFTRIKDPAIHDQLLECEEAFLDFETRARYRVDEADTKAPIPG